MKELHCTTHVKEHALMMTAKKPPNTEETAHHINNEHSTVEERAKNDILSKKIVENMNANEAKIRGSESEYNESDESISTQLLSLPDNLGEGISSVEELHNLHYNRKTIQMRESNIV